MEPMNLGSPTGSPAANYLPAFLMGETTQTPTTPRTNTLSPNNVRNLSFAMSPGANSPQDRSVLGQKTLFGGGYQQTPTHAGTPIQSHHNASLSGPPTQGLFDSLRNELNQAQTPTRSSQMQQPLYGTPQNHSGFAGGGAAFNMNQSYQLQQQTTAQCNDSYISNISFNASRLVSPLGPSPHPAGTMSLSSNMLQCPPTPRYTEFWVTVFGFPPSASSIILQHFAQCGIIVDKVFPPQNGNWVHLKYSSRLECDKALTYNEKILGNNIMIGVTQCKDKNIIDKENLCENTAQPPKVRSLAQTAYKCVQSDSAVVASPNAPQKSSGIMNKAMDLFFGW